MCITHGHIFMTLGDSIAITHLYAWVRLNSHCNCDIITVRDVYSCWNHVSHLTALKLILNYSDCSLNQNDFGIIVKRNNISPPVYVLRKQADCWHRWAGRGERCKMSINTECLKSTETSSVSFEVCTCKGDMILRPYAKYGHTLMIVIRDLMLSWQLYVCVQSFIMTVITLMMKYFVQC